MREVPRTRKAPKTREALEAAIIVAGIVTGLGAGIAALAVPAAASPTGDISAADTVKHLQDQGYAVQINGSAAVPLSQCLVTGVHGLPDTKTVQFTTVYVDVSCASDN